MLNLDQGPFLSTFFYSSLMCACESKPLRSKIIVCIGAQRPNGILAHSAESEMFQSYF